MRLFINRQVWDLFENQTQRSAVVPQHAVACSLASVKDLQVQQRRGS